MKLELIQEPGGFPKLLIDGIAQSDVESLMLWAEPKGLRFLVHRTRVIDGAAWESDDELHVAEINLSARLR